MTLREHAVTAAWVGAGLVCVVMMQRHADLDEGGMVTRGDVPRGRRLAGDDNEYAQALRSISDIWSSNSSSTGNGLPGSAQLIISTCLVLVLGSLAAGAGIGGGGLFVPIYMVLLGAGPKGAVPLSKATILGGAVGNFISIGPARHPKAKRPMIDYESSTLMQSGELLGVVFGVLLNNLLPAIVIVTFLVLILSYNSFKTLKKAFAIRKKETKAFEKAKAETAKESAAEVASAADAEAPAPSRTANAIEASKELEADKAQKPEDVDVDVGASGADPAVSATPKLADAKVATVHMYGSCVDVRDAKPEAAKVASSDAKADGAKKDVSPELQKIMDADSKQYPVWAWALLGPMTAYTLVYKVIANIIKNDPGCSPVGFWLWYVTPVPILGGFMVYTAWILGKRHAAKLAAGFDYLPADMQWDSKTLRRFPVTALLAGVTAGLLGIGGGMVIGPLFLSIGMEPQVGTSSCAFMILWTAFSGVVIYGVDEHLGAELAIWCVSFGFISGQIGQRLVNTVLKKTGRPSYVVFLLGSIIGAACIAMAITLIIKMATGDYDANDVVEPDETVQTHLFYLGSGFGCKAPKVTNSSY